MMSGAKIAYMQISCNNNKKIMYIQDTWFGKAVAEAYEPTMTQLIPFAD